MLLSHKSFARRVLLATVGTGAVLLSVSLPAHAQPDPPNCTSADLAGVMSGITAATSVYLFTHPPVNEFMTSMGDLPPDEKKAALGAFLEANPQVKGELQGIRQPAVDFRNRCGGGPGPLDRE
ncbi:MAG: heme-binding protein [Actinomycetia bacterium]|nr:heme-binding protein [Actinomycetes bacterium]